MELEKEEIEERERMLKINLIYLGRALKTLRKLRGMTLDDVAVDANMDTAQLSRIENGKLPTSIRTLSNVCAVYSMSIKELYDVADALNA